jgi:hypothetical protein
VNASIYDRFTRHAAAMPRRRSLLTLGGMGLTALVIPASAGAGKDRKASLKRCKRQREPCRAFMAERCEGSELCEEAFFRCCEHFARCEAEAGLACWFDTPQPPDMKHGGETAGTADRARGDASTVW